MFTRMVMGLIGFWQYLKDVDLLPGKSAALHQAEQVALVLQRYCAERVELFGSVARCGAGADIDLIVVVNDEVAERFRRAMPAQSDGYGHAFERFETATWLLEELAAPWHRRDWLDEEDEYDHYRPEDDLQYKLRLATLGQTPDEMAAMSDARRWRFRDRVRQIDIFLLPEDWKTNPALRAEFPMKDPNFFDNIARDAKTFDRSTGRFEGLAYPPAFTKYNRKHPEVRKWLSHVNQIVWRLDRRYGWRWYRFQCRLRKLNPLLLLRSFSG